MGDKQEKLRQITQVANLGFCKRSCAGWRLKNHGVALLRICRCQWLGLLQAVGFFAFHGHIELCFQSIWHLASPSCIARLSSLHLCLPPGSIAWPRHCQLHASGISVACALVHASMHGSWTIVTLQTIHGLSMPLAHVAYVVICLGQAEQCANW
jgi:hypothetical protein